MRVALARCSPWILSGKAALCVLGTIWAIKLMNDYCNSLANTAEGAGCFVFGILGMFLVLAAAIEFVAYSIAAAFISGRRQWQHIFAQTTDLIVSWLVVLICVVLAFNLHADQAFGVVFFGLGWGLLAVPVLVGSAMPADHDSASFVEAQDGQQR
jgi:hypothetical protein